MATYRVMGYVPTVATLPGDPSPTVVPAAKWERGLALLGHFPQDVYDYSHGMCEIDLKIRVLSDPLPASRFSTVSGQQIILPTSVANQYQERNQYDAFVLMNAEEICRNQTFRGIAGTSSGTPYAWCRISSDERRVLAHEWGHAMTAYLGTVRGSYSNFPSCPPEPAMHCNADYGYDSDIEDGWLEGFLSGTLPDGKGINASGWAIGPPTAFAEALNEEPYIETRSPWGLTGPLVGQNVG